MITKQQLECYCNEGVSTYGMASAFGVSQSTIMYWLKKHGLKTKRKNPRAWEIHNQTK
jgi:transposase